MAAFTSSNVGARSSFYCCENSAMLSRMSSSVPVTALSRVLKYSFQRSMSFEASDMTLKPSLDSSVLLVFACDSYYFWLIWRVRPSFFRLVLFELFRHCVATVILYFSTFCLKNCSWSFQPSNIILGWVTQFCSHCSVFLWINFCISVLCSINQSAFFLFVNPRTSAEALSVAALIVLHSSCAVLFSGWLSLSAAIITTLSSSWQLKMLSFATSSLRLQGATV